MKRFSLLSLSCMLLLAVACNQKETTFEYTSEDESLAGSAVTAGDASSSIYKLFVLNEGKMGGGNASLDFLRFKDGLYVTNSFSRMNPTVTGGLGDTANDIAVIANYLWIPLTGSGLVEVASGLNETHIGTVSIPTPRKVAFDAIDGSYYAYVTSYSGAVYGGDARLGSLYKVSAGDLSVVKKIDLGYQPEGVVVCGNNIYVACSGGYNGYTIGYDNRLFVVDRTTFEVVDSIQVAPNLNLVVSDGESSVWVASAGDYYSTHSGLYHVNTATKAVTQVPDVRVSTLSYDYYSGKIYVLGTDDEWVWDSKQKFSVYVVDGKSVSATYPLSKNSDASSISYPYGILRNPKSGEIYITDSGDWTNPGYVYSFSSDLSKTNWKAEAGIGPSHMALYSIY